MAEEIVIKTVLDLSGSEQRLKQQVEKALSSPEAQTAAKNAGKKLGDALGLGIETTRRSREDKELAHQRRLETISAQSNARLVEIERRKQAQLDTIRERGVQKELEQQRRLERAAQSNAGAVAGLRSAFAALAGVGVVALFERIGRSALDAAISMDRQLSTLRALTGSAEAAQKRFAELFALAQKTPGLTTNLAATLDAQLRIFNVTQQTIDKLLPVVGRLNAISPIPDPRQFVNNLTQLISQNFERQDLKELVSQSPIAGQLIKGIFDVENPTNAKAIREAAKRLGITTVERLAEELIKEGANNTALKNAVETLGGQFDKLQERAQLALAPIGKEIAGFLIPLFKDLIPLAEDFGNTLTRSLQDNRGEIAQFRKAVVDLAAAFSSLGKISIPILGDILQTAANGVGFYVDLANMFRGDFSFGNSRANFGNLLPGGGTPSAQNRALSVGAPSRFGLLGAVAPTGGGGGGGGGGTGGGTGTRRRRGIEFLPLTAEDLVTSQFEGELTPDDLRAVSAARARGRDLRRKLTLETEQARRDLINEGRDTRRRLTAEADAGAIAELQRLGRRDLTRSGRSIGDLVNRGAITSGEADALGQAANREFANKLREILALEQERGKLTEARKDDLQDEIDLYDRLGTSISNSERFMRGFNIQVETVGDAFDRFGANVARAFGNVRDLFNGLKQAVLGFFNDLLGSSLQNLVRSVLSPIFGGGGRGGGGGGGIGNIFQSLFAGGGGGISTPASVSGGAGAVASSLAFGGSSLGRFGIPGLPIFGGGTTGAAQPGFSLGALGGSLAAAAPLLGLSLGAGLGGTSTAGNILGAIGGGAVGLGVAFGSAVFGAGGGLASAALAALGPAALIGAPLIVGAILLGKAAQRRKDEEASGQFLTQALQGIEQLAAGVASGQIATAGEARSTFETNILGTFRQQIGGLKTESVRRSRLTNQVRDLEAVYQARIPPLIAEQQKRAADQARFAAIDRRLIPEFASGGFVPGIDRGRDSVLSLLRPGEMVLTRSQQAAVMMQSNASVFERAGVPRMALQAGNAQAFQFGGTAQAASLGPAAGPAIVIDQLTVVISRLGIGESEAQAIAVTGLNSDRGRAVTVKNVKVARTNREL